MTPTPTSQNSKKKLIEVALPLAAISAASAREKSIRHGHPSTLHLYWARRPLAACRAVLFAQLVDDPSAHPDKFPTDEAQQEERERLFRIIEELVLWENSTNEEVLGRARAEILASNNGKMPPVYDPFSGGGSIPLEAQRLGLPAYGSDLNPVAVMIGKAMIEIPPLFKDQPPVNPDIEKRMSYRNAEGLAADVKYYGEWMREKAFERIGHLYPQVDLPAQHGGGKANVIAWIWARTVPSPDPAFAGIDVPIASNFALSTKKGKETWIEPIVDRATKTIRYEIREGGSKEQMEVAKTGTKSGRGANFVCLFSGAAIEPEYVKRSGCEGQMKSTLIAIVAEGKRSRIYLPPSDEHRSIAAISRPEVADIPLPRHPQYIGVLGYGFNSFVDLFTDRQLVALNTFSELVHEARGQIEQDALAAGLSNEQTSLRDGGTGAKAYAEAASVFLGFGVSKGGRLSFYNCNMALR
jgi:putative DNA methylase